MACVSCATGGCSTKKKTASGVSGCRNNGTCGTGGCNKMNVFDWLGNMNLPDPQRFNVVEIRFKGGRKEYFRNTDYIDLCTGDWVVVDAGNGYHIGEVTLQGELVRLQILKKKVKDDEIKNIYRMAADKDLEKLVEVQNRELPTLYRTRQIVEELKLTMKMSDVEYQADNTKATFYYSAEERVDFRELIKILASEFKIRVEMRQISLRQEAGRLGGIGSCGRELCCSTWLSDFKSVSTAAARYQNLSLNPSKLSGQCGRLKCCLNYELETYLDALVDIPKVEKPLLTVQGEAHLQKTDIFKKIMWFSYDTESTWYPISTEQVKEIQTLNEQGIPAESLSVDEPKTTEKVTAPNQNVQLDDREKDRINSKKSSKSKKKKNKNKKEKGDVKLEATEEVKAENNQPEVQKSDNPRREQKQRPERQENRQPRSENRQRQENRQKENRQPQENKPENKQQQENKPENKQQQENKPENKQQQENRQPRRENRPPRPEHRQENKQQQENKPENKQQDNKPQPENRPQGENKSPENRPPRPEGKHHHRHNRPNRQDRPPREKPPISEQ